MKRLPDQLVRDKNKTGLPNLRHRATHSSHHTKDKQRFVVSVITYDSLPGHQRPRRYCQALQGRGILPRITMDTRSASPRHL